MIFLRCSLAFLGGSRSLTSLVSYRSQSLGILPRRSYPGNTLPATSAPPGAIRRAVVSRYYVAAEYLDGGDIRLNVVALQSRAAGCNRWQRWAAGATMVNVIQGI